MRFKDILDEIKAETDYYPDSDTYKLDLRRAVNNALLEFGATKRWPFLIREKVVTANPDLTVTGCTFTAGSTTVTTTSPTGFPKEAEGEIIIGPDGNEYEIATWTDPTTVDLTQGYMGATATADATIQYRYLLMPEDVVEVIAVFDPDNQDVLIPASRAYALDAGMYEGDTAGEPDYWVRAETHYLLGLHQAPVAARAAGGSLTPSAGYEFAVTLSSLGTESALSPASDPKITVDAANGTINLTLPDTGSYRKNVYARFDGFGQAWRLVQPGVPGATTALTYNTPIEANWYSPTTRRAPEHNGQVYRLRLYRRQDSQYNLKVRYLARPPLLYEDDDVPAMPSGAHRYLVYAVLADLWLRHDNDARARIYAGKMHDALEKIASRYMPDDGGNSIKKGNWSGALDWADWTGGPMPWWHWGTITHV